jgi:hypothetical protein
MASGAGAGTSAVRVDSRNVIEYRRLHKRTAGIYRNRMLNLAMIYKYYIYHIHFPSLAKQYPTIASCGGLENPAVSTKKY